MITFKKFGKTVKITNADWKRLRARFNPRYARLEKENNYYYINQCCSLCNRYSCEDCPFGVFGEEYGCYSFFDKLFRNGMNFCHGSIPSISWSEEDDKEARKQLNRLQRMMDKIEASQGRRDGTK